MKKKQKSRHKSLKATTKTILTGSVSNYLFVPLHVKLHLKSTSTNTATVTYK